MCAMMALRHLGSSPVRIRFRKRLIPSPIIRTHAGRGPRRNALRQPFWPGTKECIEDQRLPNPGPDGWRAVDRVRSVCRASCVRYLRDRPTRRPWPSSCRLRGARAVGWPPWLIHLICIENDHGAPWHCPLCVTTRESHGNTLPSTSNDPSWSEKSRPLCFIQYGTSDMQSRDRRGGYPRIHRRTRNRITSA
jgi:hypothetical protein